MKTETESDDRHRMASFRNGEEKAFAYFFDLHYKSLCYFARAITQEQQQAEDLVSECMVKLWNHRQTFHTAHNIKAFLYITCKNACLNYLRNSKRLDGNKELYLSQLEIAEDNMLYQIIETEVLAILHREIEELPHKCRDVFKLIYMDNKNTEEIATQLGISVKTVRGHKARAIQLLKSQLLKKGLSAVVLLAIFFFLDNR